MLYDMVSLFKAFKIITAVSTASTFLRKSVYSILLGNFMGHVLIV